MAPAASPSETPSDPCLGYIMLVLSTCEALKPNYHAVATHAGICDANTAQKKFKKFVEQAGYSLVKGAIIGPDGSPAASAAATNTTPKKKASPGKKAGPKGGAKAKAANSNKKRKVDDLEEKAKEEVNEGGEIGAAPATEPAAEHAAEPGVAAE